MHNMAGGNGAGTLLRMIRRRRGDHPQRRAGAPTGLARSTVALRIDRLIADGLVTEAGDAPSTGGRPPTFLAFNREAGRVLVADLGATHARLGVTDLAGQLLAEEAIDLDIATGPEAVLGEIELHFDALLDGTGGSTTTWWRWASASRPGRVRRRPGGQPTDHAGVARLPDP